MLASHTTGQNKIAEKGAIIIRIVNYVLSLHENDEQTQFRLYTLGKAHAKRKIRPYMYSIFVQVMLYTISAQLGTHATHEGTFITLFLSFNTLSILICSLFLILFPCTFPSYSDGSMGQYVCIYHEIYATPRYQRPNS